MALFLNPSKELVRRVFVEFPYTLLIASHFFELLGGILGHKKPLDPLPFDQKNCRHCGQPLGLQPSFHYLFQFRQGFFRFVCYKVRAKAGLSSDVARCSQPPRSPLPSPPALPPLKVTHMRLTSPYETIAPQRIDIAYAARVP